MSEAPQNRTSRKRKTNPHDPALPLTLWIPRARQFSSAMDILKERRQHFVTACNLPKGWSIHHKNCRIRCPACPHVSFSKRGLKGRSLALSVAQLSRKYSAVENAIKTQKLIEHFSGMAILRVKSLSRDFPPTTLPQADFTPIPFHLLAWKIIENNREVIQLQRSLVDWNTENNRAHKDQVTRQGALGFQIKKLQSGAFYPRWVIWTRGEMGQWVSFKMATPTFGKGYKDQNRMVRIPVRLTALVCTRTGNKNHKYHYLSQEGKRAEILKKIRLLNHDSRSLSLIHGYASSIKVK